MVGKYVNLKDAYISLNEALMHAGLRTRTRVNIEFIEATDIEKHGTQAASPGMDAILVPGGFGERGIEGKIAGRALCARERDSLPRHLPRHAARGHRVRAQRRGPRRARTAPSSIAPRRTR